jgi:hypothetical protein
VGIFYTILASSWNIVGSLGVDGSLGTAKDGVWGRRSQHAKA